MSIRGHPVAALGGGTRGDQERFLGSLTGAQQRTKRRRAGVDISCGGGGGGLPALVLGLGGLELEPRSEAARVELAVFCAGDGEGLKRGDPTPPPMPPAAAPMMRPVLPPTA